MLYLFLSLSLQLIVSLDNPLYPPNSLTNSHHLYPFGGPVPSPRIRHSVEVIDPFVLVYGGTGDGIQHNETFLDDMNIYDIHMQSWTGIVTRKECCNQNEEIVERMGSSNDDLVASLPIGFQGSLPPGRADHGTAVVNNLMYMFGGLSSSGYLNDFFSFDVSELKWRAIKQVTVSWPSRRAGHSMVSDETDIYIFGGRSLLSDGSLSCLNDVWKYDLQFNSWLSYPLQSSDIPHGRQYAAATISQGQLWLFGGIDSLTGLTFNDLWSYDLTLRIWTQRSPQSGSLTGFIPPPLHHAHLIPSSFTSPTLTLLVYGGISQGGACGNSVCQSPSDSVTNSRTYYGQLYRFDIPLSPLPEGTKIATVVDTKMRNTFQSIQFGSGSWQFARLSSDLYNGLDSGGSGKYLKRYGLEQVSYSNERQTLFEFGGIEVKESLSTWSQIPNPRLTTSDSSTNTIKSIDRKSQLSIELKTGNGPNMYEAGGRLFQPHWDLYTGEEVRNYVEVPIDNLWWYEELIGVNDTKSEDILSRIDFRQKFYHYTVAQKDMILFFRQSN